MSTKINDDSMPLETNGRIIAGPGSAASRDAVSETADALRPGPRPRGPQPVPGVRVEARPARIQPYPKDWP